VKVVYLLHGLTDNCTGWTRYSSCERYARERGVALVIPEVQRSFYIDGVYGLKYFTYVAEELPKMGLGLAMMDRLNRAAAQRGE
jgi:S-formylglutathione hydrolase FrmB